MSEPRTCVVSGDECVAPAGFGTASGYAYGDRSTRATCWVCEEPVCVKCSKRRRWFTWGRRRICDTCWEESQKT